MKAPGGDTHGGRTTEQGITEEGWTPLMGRNEKIVTDDSAAGMLWGMSWKRKQIPLSRVFMNVFCYAVI